MYSGSEVRRCDGDVRWEKGVCLLGCVEGVYVCVCVCVCVCVWRVCGNEVREGVLYSELCEVRRCVGGVLRVFLLAELVCNLTPLIPAGLPGIFCTWHLLPCVSGLSILG